MTKIKSNQQGPRKQPQGRKTPSLPTPLALFIFNTSFSVPPLTPFLLYLLLPSPSQLPTTTAIFDSLLGLLGNPQNGSQDLMTQQCKIFFFFLSCNVYASAGFFSQQLFLKKITPTFSFSGFSPIPVCPPAEFFDPHGKAIFKIRYKKELNQGHSLIPVQKTMKIQLHNTVACIISALSVPGDVTEHFWYLDSQMGLGGGAKTEEEQ